MVIYDIVVILCQFKDSIINYLSFAEARNMIILLLADKSKLLSNIHSENNLSHCFSKLTLYCPRTILSTVIVLINTLHCFSTVPPTFSVSFIRSTFPVLYRLLS